ncbi:hypothetical protein ACVXHA_06030 [Escherichia coli]
MWILLVLDTQGKSTQSRIRMAKICRARITNLCWPKKQEAKAVTVQPPRPNRGKKPTYCCLLSRK